MYKIETHLHTLHVSKCGRLNAAALAEAYHQAGYDAICVTDHYNRDTVKYLHLDLTHTDGLLEQFLQGYDRMCVECAKYGIRVYRGAELRFDECQNDYLLYDWPDELLRDFDRNMSMSIVDFAPLSRAAGALLIQAHPFRDPCTAAIACYLDGVEVLNAHPRHDSRNELTEHFAQVQNLSIRTAGSDCHQVPDIARSGILSDTLPADSHEFAQLLRSGRFQLIVPGKA